MAKDIPLQVRIKLAPLIRALGSYRIKSALDATRDLNRVLQQNGLTTDDLAAFIEGRPTNAKPEQKPKEPRYPQKTWYVAAANLCIAKGWLLTDADVEFARQMAARKNDLGPAQAARLRAMYSIVATGRTAAM